MNEKISKIVFDSLNEILNIFGKSCDVNLNTCIKGPNGILDSLEFVTFVSELEPKLEEDINILDQISNNPDIFLSVENLIKYIEKK